MTLQTDGRTDVRTDGRTDGRWGYRNIPAFSSKCAGINTRRNLVASSMAKLSRRSHLSDS